MIAEVSHEFATTLGKPNLADYTFQSFKSSATAAADDRASAQQLISFCGWKSVNMPQEYISAIKRALINMASLISNQTSLEPKPSARKGSSGSARICLFRHRRIFQFQDN